MHKWDGPQSFPYVITVFSAPNYCGYFDNKAAVMIMAQGNLSLKQFDETVPPYRLPDNMDVFNWSLPFLAEKVCSMLYHCVEKVGEHVEGMQEQCYCFIVQLSLGVFFWLCTQTVGQTRQV